MNKGLLRRSICPDHISSRKSCLINSVHTSNRETRFAGRVHYAALLKALSMIGLLGERKHDPGSSVTFILQYKPAEQRFIAFHQAVINNSAKKGDWRASAWTLARRARGEYGDQPPPQETGKTWFEQIMEGRRMGTVLEIQKEWRENPLSFVSDFFKDVSLWTGQFEVLESLRDNETTLVKSPHGMGKTFTGAIAVWWFIMSHTPCKIITTAPSWTQVQKLLWGEVNALSASMRPSLEELGCTLNQMELSFNSEYFAFGFSPGLTKEDPAKRITGFHSPHILVLFDEGPSCSEELWTYKATIMTGADCRFLAIGNPIKSYGSFYEGFNNPDNSRISLDIFQSPNFVANGVTSQKKLEKIIRMDPEERQALIKTFHNPVPGLSTVAWAVKMAAPSEWDYGSPLYNARVLGLFPKTATDTVIAYSELEEARFLEPTVKTVKSLGIDVARFGDDATVFYGAKDGRQVCFEQWKGQDTVRTSRRIFALIRDEGYDIVVIDDTGVGGGVTDQVNDLIDESGIPCRVLPVNFAESAGRDDKYADLPTELYFNTRDIIRRGEFQTQDVGRLFSQLSSRRFSYDAKARYKIESKKDYKKRTGQSPDEADATVLCLYGISQYGSTAGEGYSNEIAVGGCVSDGYDDFF